MSALRILLADDNRDCIQSMARLLRLLGHEVVTAESGEEALATAEAARPELILLDIGMPGMSGYVVAERLRQLEPTRSAAIFAISGLSSDDCRQQAAAAGFDGYLVKPVSVQTLEKLIPECQTAGASRKRMFHGAHDWSLP